MCTIDIEVEPAHIKKVVNFSPGAWEDTGREEETAEAAVLRVKWSTV